MAPKPEPQNWLELVQRFERAVGEPIEAFVRSDAYFDLMTQANRARARFTRVFEQAAEEWLHLFNVPAASDVRRLREQLSRVERQLNQVAKDVADLEDEREVAARVDANPVRPRARRRKAPAAGPTPSASGGETGTRDGAPDASGRESDATDTGT